MTAPAVGPALMPTCRRGSPARACRAASRRVASQARALLGMLHPMLSVLVQVPTVPLKSIGPVTKRERAAGLVSLNGCRPHLEPEGAASAGAERLGDALELVGQQHHGLAAAAAAAA